MSEQLPLPIEAMLNEEAPLPKAEENEPIYRIDENSKIPVSKHYGKLWDGRIRSAKTARKPHLDAWDEAIRYYNNSQMDHREASKEGQSGNRYFSSRRNTQWSETENIVYANTRAIIPAIYTKNPQVEFTTANEEYKAFFDAAETLVNTLAESESMPGINLKIHAKQQITATELCNIAWMEVGYVQRADSIEAARADLDRMIAAFAAAKDAKTIRQLEGELMAMEETIALSQPSGPFVRYRPPHDVLVDPNARMPDFSDANWMALNEMYPTDYLNARYGKRNETGNVMSLYEPSHVLMASDGAQDDIKNFKLFDTNEEAASYGYKDKEGMAKACYTACWRIFDKTTRRVFLYADNKWDWPIWVEADPYGLPNFYPLRPMFFNNTPLGAYARSNVVYYLDQQDAINEIADEKRRARQDIRENILYDSKFPRESVERWLKGSSNSAEGVDVPDGKKLSEMIFAKPNVMLAALPLFDSSPILAAADRVSGVSEAVRGAQFKTNTTNKAIENYNSTAMMRLDEKIDAIEDCLGKVLYDIAFLCAQYMTTEEVENIIGSERAAAWQNFPADQLRKMFRFRAVGGSTQKPTSAAKKQQALEVGNLLMQAAKFAPKTAITTMLTLFDGAFDEVTLPANWAQDLAQEAEQSLNKGRTDGMTVGGGSESESGEVSPGAGGGELDAILQAINSLPPEAKLALGKALANGAPIQEAVPAILEAVSASN